MGKLIVISGPSGAGKGTVVGELIKIYKNNEKKIHLSISCTTRDPRVGEIDGINYYFIQQDEFQSKIKNNEFLEYNQYGTGKFYGTLKEHVFSYLKDGYDVILEIDVNGYKQVLNNYNDTIGIFIQPRTLEDLEKRLRNRKTETEENIKKRLETAKSEMDQKELYHYVVINDDNKALDAALEVYNIINNKKVIKKVKE